MRVIDTTSVPAGLKNYSAPLRVLKIPFSNTATVEVNAGVYFEKGDVIEDVRVYVTTNVAASTIDVGLDGTTHNDPDGLLDGVSCVNAGWPKVVDNAEAASLLGALLQSGADGVAAVAANEGGPQRLLIRENSCPLTYTTTNHAVAGFIYVFYRSLDDGAGAYA
jgi:hypothetical protein